MKASAILRHARAKIATPERWTRLGYARDAQGDLTDPTSRAATKWSALGAIDAVTPEDSESQHSYARFFLKEAAKEVATHSLVTTLSMWNDNRGTQHPEVLAAFDRAIELALADGR